MLGMRERIRILPAKFLRDQRLERRIVEYNRENVFAMILVVGGLLVLLAVVM